MIIFNKLTQRIISTPGRISLFFTPWRLRRSVYYLKSGQYRVVLDRFWRLLRSGRFGGIPELANLHAPLELDRPFRLPVSDNPLVTIIVPVYNQIDFTWRCLRSIADTPVKYPFEVIVVDDCSSDTTSEILGQITGVRIVRNEVNQGFIRTCNHGARHALGQYLLFLNNDTYILPGWMDELVDTFTAIPEAGLVGSKLLFPNGALQEAGGIIWNDASGWNYGRGDSPEKPEYSYLREVDYCSGASIMLTKQLFNQLGGFDEHYLPAYGEDSDLAFRIREAGKKVLYQPLSRIIHFEGVTAGTSITSGVKHHQVLNKEKLFDRWAHVLCHHAAPGEHPELERERNVVRRILVVDACTPTPDQDAGSLKIFNYISILRSLSFKVSFVADNMAFIPGYTPALQRIGVECLYWPFTRSIRAHLRTFGKNYDFILSCRPEITERHLKIYRKFCPQAKVLFDTGDLHFIREQRQAEIENKPHLAKKAERRKRQELSLARNVDCTIVVSDTEKEILLAEDPGFEVATISAVHDVQVNPPGYDARCDLMFLGGYQHSPNVDAVIYFTREIFPLVRNRIPGVRFHIIGSHPPSEVEALAGKDIIVAGHVPDLVDYLACCCIAINPLRYGAGVKGKIVTAMAHGLPCVGTTVAFEGMNLVDEADVLIADFPQDFADAIVRLYKDKALWERFSSRGIEIVEQNYSFASARQRFSDVFGRLGMIDRPLRIPGTLYGTCNVCGHRGRFRTLGSAHFRETLICEQCGSSDRQRALACGLLMAVGIPGLENLNQLASLEEGPKILDTDAFSAIFRVLRDACFYQSSSFCPDIFPGKLIQPKVSNVDLMDMPFSDAAFDIILTSDVMEHVRQDEPAHREIMRCLKPGGFYVFTVPYVDGWEKNQIRIDSSGDQDILLMEKQYHQDPLNKEGVLVYRIYGRELQRQLEAIGFEPRFLNNPEPCLGILTKDVFVCRKLL